MLSYVQDLLMLKLRQLQFLNELISLISLFLIILPLINQNGISIFLHNVGKNITN